MKSRFLDGTHPRGRAGRWSVLGAAILVMGGTSRLPAQLDAEPANNSAAGANALPLSTGEAVTNLSRLSVGGNDVDFYETLLTTGEVLLGMTTPLRGLPTTFDAPDTMAGVFSAGVLQTFNDDDGADERPMGLNRGSLFRYLAGATGTFHIGVTGYGDEAFDGAATGEGHSEAGTYVLTAGRVNPSVLGGGFMDTDPSNDGIFPTVGRPGPFQPDVISLDPYGARVAVAELVSNDVDFFELHLTAGDIVSAITAPLAGLSDNFDTPDTVLALFNSAGMKVFENDDAGNEAEHSLDPLLASDRPFQRTGIRGSALRTQISTSGTYYLAVTGFSDVDYIGAHGEVGLYALLVGRAPGSAAGLLGDYNSDGVVNAADYVVYRNRRSGIGGTTLDHEFATLGEVTVDDYLFWKSQYGAGDGAGAGMGGPDVPESSTAQLALAAAASLLVGRCRRQPVVEGRETTAFAVACPVVSATWRPRPLKLFTRVRNFT